jgi:hypothetical protein
VVSNTARSAAQIAVKTIRPDPARDLAAELPVRRDLVVEVLTRMGLHRRDRRDVWHTPSVPAAPLEWLRTTFEAINNGRHPEFSLPSRIDIVVPQLLDVDDLDVSIIDTRGIDQLTARADLEALLEDPHTVSVFAPHSTTLRLRQSSTCCSGHPTSTRHARRAQRRRERVTRTCHGHSSP